MRVRTHRLVQPSEWRYEEEDPRKQPGLCQQASIVSRGFRATVKLWSSDVNNHACVHVVATGYNGGRASSETPATSFNGSGALVAQTRPRSAMDEVVDTPM